MLLAKEYNTFDKTKLKMFQLDKEKLWKRFLHACQTKDHKKIVTSKEGDFDMPSEVVKKKMGQRKGSITTRTRPWGGSSRGGILKKEQKSLW